MHEKMSEQMLVVNGKGCGRVVLIYPQTAEVAEAVKNQMTSAHSRVDINRGSEG